MPRNYESSHALCPFYREETRREIYCEGPFKNSYIRLSFNGGAEKVRSDFCCADWQQCPVARMNWEAADAGHMIGERKRA